MSYIQGRKTIGSRIGMAVTYIILFIFTFLAIYPLFWLVMSSLKTTTEYQLNHLGFPGTTLKPGTNEHFKATFGNFTYAWSKGNFAVLTLNSILYTSVTVAASLLLSLMSGFAFAKLRSKATKWMYGAYVIGLLLTLQSIMVPLFLMVNWTGLYDTRLGVLIPYIGIALPMAVYLCTEFIRSIPNALIESARIDGASFLTIFAKIIVPMAKPVATTTAILTVSGTWNEFMLVNILTSKDSTKSLPVGIKKFAGQLNSDYGRQFAALVIGLAPMLAFYLIFRKEITKGVAAGAVKG
ncbi:MAG: carbohydrate ABC transporter permease [Sphaerochaetaceae bacterium]|jgi:raffinose/stachyose/melibiose transport system permease protein|nr:carbohydrate ABC transporter permease [Sphaerochaetaceae bacterium]